VWVASVTPDRARLPRVCSTCCFSAEGTDSGSVSSDDALRGLSTDDKSDALLRFLEECLLPEDGELKQETQAAQPSQTLLGDGRVIATGEVGRADGASVVGTAAADVDTINELIHSDHHYHKDAITITVASSDALIKPVPSTLPALAPKGLEGLRAKLALPARQVVVVAPPAPVVAAAPVASPISPLRPVGASNQSRAALATMVDPNEVCGTLSPRQQDSDPNPASDVPDLGSDLDLDMWKSLEGLLTLDGLEEFTMDTETPESSVDAVAQAEQVLQETVANLSSPTTPVASIIPPKSCKRKLLSPPSPITPTVCAASPPPAMVPDATHVLEGHSFETRIVDGQTFVEVVFDEEQACKLSPSSSVLSVSDLSDSGFSGSISNGSASPLSDSDHSEENLNDFTMSLDGSGFLEDFGELFPNIAY